MTRLEVLRRRLEQLDRESRKAPTAAIFSEVAAEANAVALQILDLEEED